MSGHVDAARSAAAGSASCTTALAAQQRMLLTHVEGLEAATLAPLQKQLVATQALLLASETERKRVTKQAVAAAAMARLEVRLQCISVAKLLLVVAHCLLRSVRVTVHVERGPYKRLPHA